MKLSEQQSPELFILAGPRCPVLEYQLGSTDRLLWPRRLFAYHL